MTTTVPDPVDVLAVSDLFASASRAELERLVAGGAVVGVSHDSVLAHEGEVDEVFWILLDGEVELVRDEQTAEPYRLRSDHVGAWLGAGVLTGEPSMVTVRTLRDSHFFRLDREQFRAFMGPGYDLARHMLMGVSLGQRRYAEHLGDQQRLASLGKLSAGIAHELNNPAAAARRSADRLRERFTTVKATLMATAGVDAAALSRVAEAHTALAERGGPGALSAMERADAEDTVLDLLDDAGIPDPDDCAGALVDGGLGPDDVADLIAALEATPRGDVRQLLPAVAGMLDVDGIIDEIADAAERISALVASVKGFTHMDGATRERVDIHAGIEATLRLLAHQLRGLEVVRQFDADLPKVDVLPGQLNQVWTNLIDNAADALDGTGTVTITTGRSRDPGGDERLVVTIADDGPGVPGELRDRIFEPFFTTKGVGDGTGLGLDLTRRLVRGHGGRLTVADAPGGGAAFTVNLPLEGAPQRQEIG